MNIFSAPIDLTVPATVSLDSTLSTKVYSTIPFITVRHIDLLIRFSNDREFFNNLSAIRKEICRTLLDCGLMDKSEFGTIKTSLEGLKVLSDICVDIEAHIKLNKVK